MAPQGGSVLSLSPGGGAAVVWRGGRKRVPCVDGHWLLPSGNALQVEMTSFSFNILPSLNSSF